MQLEKALKLTASKEIKCTKRSNIPKLESTSSNIVSYLINREIKDYDPEKEEPKELDHLINVSRNQQKRGKININSTKLFTDLFRLPDSEKEMKKYVLYGEKLRDNIDYSILHSKSLRKIQTAIGKQSMLNVDIPEHFEPYLAKFGQGLHLPDFYQKCILAGGAIVLAYFNIQNASPDSDLDYWFYDVKKLHSVIEEYHKQFPNAIFIVNYCVVTVVVPGKTRYVQLIYKKKKPWEVIDSFDMDYIQAYYDGKELRAFPECIDSWNKRKILRIQRELPPERILKAREKGFKISFETKLKSKKSRWNFYYPKTGENREYVKHILSCVFPRASIYDTPVDVKKNFNIVSSDSDNPYHIVSVPIKHVVLKIISG
uniref:tRNA nucleotidyltransferase/poly(A) polymerase n=1 Tax=Pithovirus LCDPAC01 TaxID=2506600 RepID=A0A481YMC1_9VIRU|nr:MAG: tRNA nucleotidyltransferase/poly(A) polymerase [Pithovirus LCDPAC01]